MAEIICYGDSNTYGWDPTDAFGRPYKRPWVSVLQELSGRECRNLGRPGRRIPESEVDFCSLSALLRKEKDAQTLLILLGSNNRFLPPYDTPEECCRKMEALLSYLLKNHGELRLILIGLPPMALPGQNTEDWPPAVNELYARLSEKYAIPYFDPLPLQLPLAYDGLHLTEEAHIRLSQGIWESGILTHTAQ